MAVEADTVARSQPCTEQAPVSAVVLDPILVFGAVMCGQSVSKVVITLADGREFSIELPEPEQDQATTSRNLSRTRRKIIAILSESNTAMTRKQVQSKLGRGSGHVAGKLSQDFTALIDQDYIFERDGLLTDDEAKFD